MLAILYIFGGAIISFLTLRYLFFLVVNIIKKISFKDKYSVENIFIQSLKETFFMDRHS